MNNLTNRLIDLAIAIQQIPAPTFHEAVRAEFVRARFVEEGLAPADVKIDEAGNVYARVAGSPLPEGQRDSVRGPSEGREKALVVSAHLDTVFSSNVDLHFERKPESIHGPGIGDNSLGVAGLFGLVWALRERNLTLPGDLWLVANVCEEGLGDLRGMRAVVDRFGSSSLAYIVLEGMALGQITHRGLGVRRVRVSIRTSGGHSWIDYGQPSAIHELAALATRITALSRTGTGTTTSRPVRDSGSYTGTETTTSRPGTGTTTPRTTLNIGIISGGTSVNTIAAEAMLELDLRSESAETLEALSRQVEQIANSAKKRGVTVKTEIIGQRPSGELPADHPLVRLAEDCLRVVGVEPHLNTGSTDANLPLSRGLPSITIGLTTGGRAHTVDEYINLAPPRPVEDSGSYAKTGTTPSRPQTGTTPSRPQTGTTPLEKGMDQLIQLVNKVWDVF
jgi:acetylornithine deacetylase/succinyl-diaminopimelate desuccinylase-like protein